MVFVLRRRTVSIALALALAAGAALAQRSNAELPRVARALTLALPSLDGIRFDTAGTEGDAYEAYDLSWAHRRFELRARIVPPGTPDALAPAIGAGATATHCASNGGVDEREDFVVRWRGGREDLDRLNAEWAYFFDYAPKPAFSGRRRCYQASYYREDAGLVHVWLLYDDPGLLHSDWAYVLPFAPPPPGS